MSSASGPRSQRAARISVAGGCLLILATLTLLMLGRPNWRAWPDSPTETKLPLPLPSSHSLGRHLNSNPTRQNNGLTNVIEWDSYSLFIKGQRVFIWSALQL